jgi:hypothetical protein
MSTPYPGASEVGWLADLKQMAEQMGDSVFGEAIRWEVEVVGRTGLRRPDVIIRRERDGSILASGEAKRPDTPAGVHPLVASEVRDAREKAARLGSPVFFTTNFFEAAVFDGNTSRNVSDLDRLPRRPYIDRSRNVSHSAELVGVFHRSGQKRPGATGPAPSA